MYDGVSTRIPRKVWLKGPNTLIELLELAENAQLVVSEDKSSHKESKILKMLLKKIEPLELAFGQNNIEKSHPLPLLGNKNNHSWRVRRKNFQRGNYKQMNSRQLSQNPALQGRPTRDIEGNIICWNCRAKGHVQ